MLSSMHRCRTCRHIPLSDSRVVGTPPTPGCWGRSPGTTCTARRSTPSASPPGPEGRMRLLDGRRAHLDILEGVEPALVAHRLCRPQLGHYLQHLVGHRAALAGVDATHVERRRTWSWKNPPTPTPSTTRPPDRKSSVAVSLARMAGFLNGAMTTQVPTVIRWVCCTKAPRASMMSRAGISLTRPSVTQRES